MSSVLRLLKVSNCCWVIGGRTAFKGLWWGEPPLWLADWAAVLWLIKEFVIEAILCKGDAAALQPRSELVGGPITMIQKINLNDNYKSYYNL